MNTNTRVIIPDAGRTRTAQAADVVEAGGDRLDMEEAKAQTPEAELQAIARQADQWRIAHGMTDTEFVQRFAALTGDRKGFSQFARTAPEKWDRTAENWLGKYRKLPGALSDYDQQEQEPATLDLPHVVEFISMLQSLRRRTNEKRALWVEGDRGAGKTALLKKMRAVIGEERCIIVCGRQSWSSPAIMMEHFLRALGAEVPERKRPESAARLQERVREALAGRDDLVLGIDEAHSITGPGINALRDWINDAHESGARVHIVGAALPCLWSTLTSRYEAESLQLVRRFSDVLSIPAPDAAECLTLAGQRMNLAALESHTVAAGALLARHAATAGGRSYVADVADGAGRMGERLTWAKFQELCASAAKKNKGK